MLTSFFAFSQEQIPDTIYMKIYLGGDYRSKIHGKGATDDVDSLIYVYQEEREFYYSEKIFQTRRVFFRDEGFYSKNINMDSTLTIFNNSWAKIEEIENLTFWSQTENYEEKALEEKIEIVDSDLVLWNRETVLVPENISIEDFVIDTDRFKKECRYFNLINNENKKCRKIDYEGLLNSILNENMGMKVVSSYLQYVEVGYRIGGKKIRLIQQYPGDLNIKWEIIHNDEAIQYVLNPYLNEIVNDLIPRRLRSKCGLIEFKDKSKLMKQL